MPADLRYETFGVSRLLATDVPVGKLLVLEDTSMSDALKEAGFEVSDHIVLSYKGGAKIEDIFSRFGGEILGETLGDKLVNGVRGYTKDWDVNKEPVKLGVERV